MELFLAILREKKINLIPIYKGKVAALYILGYHTLLQLCVVLKCYLLEYMKSTLH